MLLATDSPGAQGADASLIEIPYSSGRSATEKGQEKIMSHVQKDHGSLAALPGQDSLFTSYPAVMTEEELIRFLRIPDISSSRNYRHVIENLKRTRGLPRIHLCGKTVYSTDAVKSWLESHVTYGR